MARTDFDIQVAGLKELVAGLQTLQGPELGKVIGNSLSGTARAVIVPAMRRQMSGDFQKKGSHKGPAAKRGQGGPAERNVTVRRVRKRGGELVALGIGPRAWWSRFPIGGTRAHVIEARGPGGLRASSARVRSINRQERGGYAGPQVRSSGRLTRGGRALLINGLYRERVRHPGSRGTDSIRKAVQGVTPTLNARYVADLEKAYEKHLAGPTRRARPRPPG